MVSVIVFWHELKTSQQISKGKRITPVQFILLSIIDDKASYFLELISKCIMHTVPPLPESHPQKLGQGFTTHNEQTSNLYWVERRGISE